MKFGICLQSSVAVRIEPTHTAEMVTQVLFGELYRVVENDGTWIRVQLLYDNYEGWVHLLQSHSIDEQEFLRLADLETAVTIDLVQLLSYESRQTMIPLVMGSSLPGLREGRMKIGHEDFQFDGSTADHLLSENLTGRENIRMIRQNLVNFSKLYLNAPYLWGGRTPFGIDCSGFVQIVYKIMNIKLLRDASQQAAQGEVISLLAEAESGDLAFFDNEEGKITHVGMLTDRSHIIHASGNVRIDAIDHEGIFNDDVQRYTHKLRLIKRIIS